MAMKYCKDCELYECCMRSPLGGCQEFDNVAPKPAEQITAKEAWNRMYEQLDWDWEKFRREAAKAVLGAIIAKKSSMCSYGEVVEEAIKFADELIKQLKENKK